MKKLISNGLLRLLSILLVAVILMGSFPVMASAAEGHVVITPDADTDIIEAGGAGSVEAAAATDATEIVKREYQEDHHKKHDREKHERDIKKSYNKGYDKGYAKAKNKETDKAKVVVINGNAPLPSYGSENHVVSLTSTGPSWASAGETIRYTFPEVINKSGYSLPGFYWRNEIATDAVRALTVNTGVWSGEGTYSFWVKSNRRDWRKVYSSLKRSTAYAVDMSAKKMAALGNVGYDARKTILTDAHLKVGDESGEIVMFLEREWKVICAFLSFMHPEWRTEIQNVRCKHILTPFIQDDVKAAVEVMRLANGGKAIISQRTSVERSGLVTDVDAELKLIEDEERAIREAERVVHTFEGATD